MQSGCYAHDTHGFFWMSLWWNQLCRIVRPTQPARTIPFSESRPFERLGYEYT